MQTFLAYPSFAESAKVLDRQRLGKQRLEALQILRTLRGESSAWQHHPAVRMWAGHEYLLAVYGKTICEEWRRRGYRDNLIGRFVPSGQEIVPPWLGDSRLHDSHKAALIAKFPEHYQPLWPDVEGKIDYWWPR